VTDREKLIEFLFLQHGWTPGDFSAPASNGSMLSMSRASAFLAADQLITAGWRRVPTEGPEFDAAVDRALKAEARTTTWSEPDESRGDLKRRHERRQVEAALRAALNPGGDDA